LLDHDTLRYAWHLAPILTTWTPDSGTRAWEIIRTLYYVFYLQAEKCTAFLHAYRQIYPITDEEIDLTALAYGWNNVNSLWVYEEFYLKKNQRVAHFLDTTKSPLFIEQWSSIRSLLHTV
jgi:hypothetical protein